MNTAAIASTVKQKLIKVLLRSHGFWSRLIPNFYYPYKFSGGRIYLNIKESRMMLARALGSFEPAKHKAIRQFLYSGGAFIDIGANKGDFSLLAARIVGDQGKVLAFEPEPTNCHWIKKSIQLNGYRNVELREIALSDTNGESQLHLGEKSGWHTLVPSRVGRYRGSITVPTQTLDSCLEELHWDSPINMIKIDVEGADLRVLKGAAKTLIKNRDVVLLMDIHPESGVDPREVTQFLKSLEFRIYRQIFPVALEAADYENLRELFARRNSSFT